MNDTFLLSVFAFLPQKVCIYLLLDSRPHYKQVTILIFFLSLSEYAYIHDDDASYTFFCINLHM